MLHLDAINLLSLTGFSPVSREERKDSIELMSRPDWSETKRRHLTSDSSIVGTSLRSSSYDPPMNSSETSL